MTLIGLTPIIVANSRTVTNAGISINVLVSAILSAFPLAIYEGVGEKPADCAIGLISALLTANENPRNQTNLII
jgi:hypothetical protein